MNFYFMQKLIFRIMVISAILFGCNLFSANAAQMTFQKGDGKGEFSETDDGTLDTSGSSSPQSSVLRVGRKDGSLQRFALKFPNFFGENLNQIPFGVKINSANIKLKETSNSYYNTAAQTSIGLFRILEDWEETSTTGYYGAPGWYFRKSNSVAWLNVGLGSPLSSESTAYLVGDLGRAYETTFSYNVTSEIQKLVSQLSDNRGFVFRLQDETTLDTSKEFYSSEAATVTNRPILEIDYVDVDSGDQTSPQITNPMPTGILPVHTNQTVLSIETNEDSTCKYSNSPDLDYANMENVFSQTGARIHSQTISNLSDGSSYSYFIRCMDYNSNASTTDYELTFDVAADSISPAQIQDLAVSSCEENSCSLSWTAPGDDGNSGDAVLYDIRYLDNTINLSNWSFATQLTNESVPQSSGNLENLVVDGLESGKMYYFAIKARDAAGNWSAISNIANFSTQAPSVTGSEIKVWTSDANVKIRPQDSEGASNSVSISGSKNETVSAQIAIMSSGETINNLDVSVDMPGFNSVIYKEDFMHVVTPSHMAADTGEWPDILIPKVDAFYGEQRNAFPITLNNISRAYPLIVALPSHSYGPWRDGKWMSNIEPPSGYIWPYDGTQTGGGKSDVYNQGTGKVSTSGSYLGTDNKRYLIVIESGGAIGEAIFKWSDDNGANFQSGIPTSSSLISLGNGVKVSFAGSGLADDFVANDEWIFYANPKRNQPIWIDIEIPKSASAGIYNGTISVSGDAKTTSNIPITLKVWNFEIPDTSSLKNFFGVGSNFTTGHALNYTDPIIKVYVAAGLRNRISLGDALSGDSGGGNTIGCYSYNESTGELVMGYGGFDNVMGAYLDGRGSTYVPTGITFPGKLTTFTEPAITHGGCTITDNAKFTALARADFANHLRQKGWLEQFYVYLADEPSVYNQSIWDHIISKGQQWRTAAPDVSMWVTTTLEHAQTKNATDYIDVYVPNSTTEVALGNPETEPWSYPRVNYDSFLNLSNTPKKDVWWYSACMESGSCGDVGGSYYTHWANYGVDSSAMENIMRLWLTRYYDYHGELYYAVNYNWNHYPGYNHIDPWDTSYYFSDNGDGQLFYPGRPDKIGGTKHIPIESLRLKLIRNGLQNYEYMHKLDSLGEKNFVQAQLSTIMSNVQVFTQDPAELALVRNNFAERIELYANDLVAPAAPGNLLVR